ncbi:recombinase family protein [Candidatus Amarolinea dominans]|uniref:recombinase family protein n=1 Tax=Candidatus Amarolinea dominans TaxID=3140696 RepID=UPI003136D83A|nr:recombinase family protein [Anaerolineae bacterium]
MKRTQTTVSQAQLPLNRDRAAVYVRVSTEDQAASGYGLDVQRERCAAMAVVKAWQVVKVYADEGLSGTLPVEARPGLAGLMAAAAAGELDAVIVLALDRLGRKTGLVLDVVDQLAACSVEVVSVKEALDTTTPSGRFVLTLFAALGQLERDTIVQRTTDGRNVRGRRDGERGGAVPLGYRRVWDSAGVASVEVDQEAAVTVREVFNMRSAGMTMRQIAAAVGQNWYASTVKVVLDHAPLYRGAQRGASSVVWPSIL